MAGDDARPAEVAAAAAGVLVANSAPHLASWAAAREHLTPLPGRRSSPRVNLLWGATNLLGGLALARRAARRPPADRRWDRRLVWFEGGWAGFAAWIVASEALLGVNTRPGSASRPPPAVTPVARWPRAVLAGAAVANAAPHLVSAAARREHLTPLAGGRSSPRLNLAWGGVNLAAGLALLRRRGGASRWDRTLPAFEAGWAAFALSVWATEYVTGYNSG